MALSDPKGERRLQVLRATHLLDSPPESGFDRLTRLAAGLLGTPTALVSLVDDHRQFFKSALGLKEPWASLRETPLSHSFCQYATRQRSRLVVSDAREHPVLRENLATRELDVVAYAGFPLIVEDEAVGALCVIDDKPRDWTAAELALLEELATSVVAEIELRMALRSAREQRAMMDALVESLGDAVLAVDPRRRFLVANEAARRVFGAEVGKSLPQDWNVAHQSRRPDGSTMAPEEGALARGLRGLETNDLTFTFQKPDAREPVWLEATGRPVRGADGEGVAAVGVYRDVTERRRARELFEVTLESIEDGVALVDAERRIVLANRAFATMFGLTQGRLEGLSAAEFVAHLSTLVEDPAALAQRMQQPAARLCEDFVFVRPRRRVLQRSRAPVRLPGGDGFLVTWHDVTAERDLLTERERQLVVDALTGIPNRRAAEAALHVEHERMKRTGVPVSVAVFDVDHFKRVNDELGHAAGDEVLRQVAGALVRSKRVSDTVARWGGEEFLAVLPVALDGARAFCDRARQAVETLEPFPTPRITVSAGVAQIEPGESPMDAVARADARLYDAKRGGRNQVRS